MTKAEIKKFLDKLSKEKERNIVIVDFSNVDRWQDSLGWTVGIKQLGDLVSHISTGKKFLRRFYYGEDYGPNDRSQQLTPWSATILRNARFSGFQLISKRVKYIIDHQYATGYVMKCNLDIEIAVDLVKEKDNYDTAIIFSGDGDMAYVCRYIHAALGKKVYIFGARDHIGRELIDAKVDGTICDILFVEDFEYRLNLRRN